MFGAHFGTRLVTLLARPVYVETLGHPFADCGGE
jgi:hypothetical protein